MLIGKLFNRKKNKYRYPKLNPRPSLNGLDEKLEKYLNFSGGFFIEAGANDGYTQSNTYFLEKEKGWGGLLVEGVPELYEKCRNLRRGSTVKNCALVSGSYQDNSVVMHYANLMSVVDGSLKTDSLQKEHISKGVDVQGLGDTYSIEVPASTLEKILDELPSRRQIDFFSLDVEGYELQVLEGMNLSRYRPRYILVEARFFEEVDQFLKRNNYAVVEQMSHHDFLYMDEKL